MQTLHEASYAVALTMLEIGIAEGRLPVVTGIDVTPIENDDEVSVWLLLDNEESNEHLGHIPVCLPAALVDGVDHDFLLRVLTGWQPSPSLTLAFEIAAAFAFGGAGAGEAAV